MTIVVQRTPESGGAVIGTVWINGVQTFYSIENAGCLIPAGLYPLSLYYSIRNKRIVPLLAGVPGRSYIEIHPANRPSELSGCLGMGLGRGMNWIDHSIVAVEALVKMLKPQLTAGHVCQIEVCDVQANEPEGLVA